MAEHPNATAYRRAVEDLVAGDSEAMRNLLSPDVVWHEAGNPEPVRGREAVMEIFAGLLDGPMEFDDDVHEVLANDDHVVALLQARITMNGEELQYPVVEVAHLRDGLVTERWAFMDAVPEYVSAFFAD